MKEKRKHDSLSKHKHKKNKKHKKHRKERSSSSDSDTDNEVEWVEAPAPKLESACNKREEWMNEELFVSTLTKEEMKLGNSSRERKIEAKMQEQKEEEKIKQKRELNPHWKDSGSGLPAEEESNVESLHLPSTCVGDGGYAYLKKAYLRIQEQSQMERRPMEEVAVERWGSLSKLKSLIKEAEERMETLTRDRYKSRGSRHRDEHERTSSSSFKKPSNRSRSPSPEHAFRFQKPKDSNRNRKNFLVSSSRQKSSSYTDVKFTSEEEDSSCHSRSVESEDCMAWERTRASLSSKSRVPAWKKVKPSHEGYKNVQSEKTDKSSLEQYHHDRNTRDSREKERETPEAVLSEDYLNRLAAKHFKAMLSGDISEADRLKEELNEARKKFKSEGSRNVAPVRDKEKVLLTKMDSSGQQRPIKSSREEAGFERQSKHKQSSKYFDDTSRYSLKQMFEREKLTTTDDNIEMFLDVAAQCDDRTDDNDNETSGISKKASQKMAHSVQEEKDIGKAMRQHQKMNLALEKCEYCMDQPNMKRHLIVSISEQAYLCIPNYQALIEHHCLVVPKRHVPSFLALEEDEWNDVEELKNLLRHFFKKQEKSLICLETSMSFQRCPHAVLECIPVPVEEGDMAPLYFKKALLESEEEWTHNIKLIDLTKKGLRRSVPKNLPYFSVTFDPSVHAGYAHVIEDEKYFPRNFGKEVIGGMLDIDYNYLYKNRREDPLKKSKEALNLTRLLEDFKETIK
ncbi:CWF19-like protein 2 [Nephila pilipes]|uniref:CWF19-like protein 2 n=1 Tax=Nephila pilipes TaxID=299642 RepID=A0A8X6IKZ5_NEPPI|nr:CWF19-like protein 2 [Nephila pilipes]